MLLGLAWLWVWGSEEGTGSERGGNNGIKLWEVKGWGYGKSYISGSFCVSMTAATGMPKLETGPQKSGGGLVS